jgi:Zinc carboxypeptidase
LPVVPTLDVENYLDFKGMTQYLKAVSSAAPHLVRAFSIGKSKAGRPLLVAEVTNRNLREGRQKPGIWIDGGHQGWNILGSIASLELLRFLVAGHGRDEFLTDLVDHTVFYIAPRLAPDEMEHCLKNGALVPQRSLADVQLSLQGRQFRIESPLGSWKPCKRDNRVLVPRNPEDRKGPFYHLHRYIDGDRIGESGPNDFPSPQTDGKPLRLPSTRAVFEFMRSYNNVFGVISTTGPGDRVQLVSTGKESGIIEQLGRRLSELAGLPFSPAERAHSEAGQFLTWASESLGLLAADCQMWSLRSAAGLKENDLENPFQADETEILHLLRFCEKEFPEGSFGEWAESEDSVLGKGELGGWDWSKTWLNPPNGPYLGRELKKLSRLALGLASASPRLSLAEVEETVVGWSDDNEPLRRVSILVENRGYMPTCPVGTGQNMEGKLTLELGQNSLLMGQPVTSLTELRGTGSPQVESGLFRADTTSGLPVERTFRAEFLVKGSGPLEVSVAHPLAGTESTISRPPQGLRPPSFDASAPLPPAVETPSTSVDQFEDAFPSFEDLYQEPVEPVSRATRELDSIPTPPLPPPPPPEPVIPPMRTPEPSLSSEFNIPDPPQTAPSQARPVTFGSLDPPEPDRSKSPFPTKKPSKGRVFGNPPQKPTGGLPMGLSGMGGDSTSPKTHSATPSTSEGEFSPLPLVKPQRTSGGAFEPMLPIKPVGDGDIFGADTMGDAAPSPPGPPQQPASPPARLARSAPKLLRRQRGGQGPNEPFKRS